jgi:hypothetical protein
VNSEERKYQTEVTPEVIWPTAKSLITAGSTKRPTAIHGISKFKFNSINKRKAISDFLENQLVPQYCVTTVKRARGWRLIPSAANYGHKKTLWTCCILIINYLFEFNKGLLI